MLGPYVQRPIRFLKIVDVGDWRIKLYSISYRHDIPPPDMLDAGEAIVRDALRTCPTRHETYGLGFASVHEGRGENQIIIDRWINENELLHHIYVSPAGQRTAFAPLGDADHNSVCIWELWLQAFERQVWLDYVLTRWAKPDFDAYLAARGDFQV
jgi:hypothetical protein